MALRFIGAGTRRPSPGNRRFVLAVATLVSIVGLLLGLVVQRLLDTVTAATERATRAGDVVNTALRLDALEWRLIAGEPLDDVQAEVDRLIPSILQPLPSGSGAAATAVQEASIAYTQAIRTEIELFASGDLAAALEYDEAAVDPTFDELLDVATALVAREQAAAASTTRDVGRFAWTTVLVGLLAVGVGLLVVARRRSRRVLDFHDEMAGRRFRALVESSADVITIVSEEQRVTVMSPSLGFLAAMTDVDDPTEMAQLLPATSLDQWAEFDGVVRAGKAVDGIEMSLTRRDGSLATVELMGRPLVDEPGHRVWVWRDVSGRKALETELTHRAFHDALTGLANRTLLMDRIDHALRRAERTREPIAVLLCDLDDFKTVNDVLGHHVGDELLRTVAERMRGCVRGSDTLARLGGDEFAVLIENADLELAQDLATRLLEAVNQHVELDGRDVYPGLSIGLAPFEIGATTEELLRRSDVAMYDAKRAGKGRVSVYRHGETRQQADALVMHSELRQAILHGGLHLAYQPTVSLVDGSISSVEALVRWTHPVVGPVPPMTFIPMAEQSGSIVALGRWVLEEACRAAVSLTGTDGCGITMHVNVSPHQLNDPTFVTFVKETLDVTGLDPELLVLEVTEGALLSGSQAVDRLVELHGHGVRLAIDDFGTGYASITYLQRLPIDILKIDRAFVSGDALPESERKAFLSTIISMAQHLNLTSVAEGVETDAQRLEVADLGCDRGQGYLWARPVDLDTLRTTISEHRSGVAET